MSTSRRLTRSSVSSTRTFSGSEDENESDISIHRIVRPRLISNNNSTYTPSRTAVLSGQEVINQNLLNNHKFYGEKLQTRYTGDSDPDGLSCFSESSHPGRLTVQSSLFHRFRWFIWRCIYLKIIRTVNFDVWLLSRLHNYGKHKVIFFFLLPLLLYLFWHIIPQSPLTVHSLSQVSNSVISSLLYILSIFSSAVSHFVQKCPQFSYGSLIKQESAPSSNEKSYNLEEPIIQEDVFSQPKKEGISLSEDDINSLKAFLKANIQETEANKLEKDSRLQNEIRKLQLEFQSLSGVVTTLEEAIQKQSEKSDMKEDIIAVTSVYKSQIDYLKVKLNAIEEKLSVLESLKNCCDKQWKEEDLSALLEKHLILAFKNVIDGDSDPKSKYYFFNAWLNTKFSTHEKKIMQLVDSALKIETAKLDHKMDYDNVKKVVEGTVLKYVDSIKKNISEMKQSGYSAFNIDLFSEDRIKQIVKEAIMLYDADKIGQVDYALESGGGSVLGTRCSETYAEKYGKLSIFGLPLWTDSNSPRTAIQPDVQPGRCWAFKGSQGFLVIELAATIYPTGFTLEHIPVSLSPSGSVDSAPKNFSVWGLDSEKDNNGSLLGEYWYDIHGDPLQYFAVQKPSEKPYTYVELQIHSNHGNVEYTCLYRFRVHGKRVR